ncbi:putative bifunctional diguanylate cyclase/phosphodiesterase [Ruminococcus flavefaciens]|uniref:putative bifunctional diguanylate cyclase/phosphodiesterase n=1 Tax=Ruminococcus flavefaciens TaxID=1265 RepID=UPI00046398A3|nr:bifunctional diguanylate cyclase/phosphodiesterase [Ruminococcus flavefaciens]
MDFQKFIETFFSPACVVSVEKTADNGYGKICIVACNKKYLDMIDYRISSGNTSLSSDDALSFVNNSLYFKYFPMNRNFEDVCFKSAVQKKEIHTYVHLNSDDMWFDIYVMPLDCENGSTCYCIYSAVPSDNADNILGNVHNNQISNDVLKTCIKLHKATGLKDAMEGVISEIRRICDAESCTVLLLKKEEENYSILATNFKPGSRLKPVTEFPNYYDIASSWEKMIGDEGDCIIIQNKSDLEYVSRINNPWYLTLVEAGVESVVLYPLRQENEVLGYIWATNFNTDITLRIKETLELTTFFVSSHIAKYKVLRRLNHMSYTDSLTGLPNRFASTEYIADLINHEGRFAVVYIDLNHFKRINDTLGLEAGNQVLIEIAERWKAVSDDYGSVTSDYITRINGDEFLLVIYDYNSDEELREAIVRYADALNDHLSIGGVELYVTASFGYAEYPADAGTADELISYSSAAMSEIKKANSSDHILRFTSDILSNERILEVENKIRVALENDLIYFNLQPQFDMAHKLRGFEALARMRDADGNFISPGEFVPVAEKVGLVDKVDEAVFRKAAMFLGGLIRKTGADIVLSVNVSVLHLMKNDFLDELKDILKESGMPSDRVEIEITESIMIESAEKAILCIDKLREMGIRIAIDDFGTGYSSLSYLNNFPANLLKIDKSFIDKMNLSESSKQYVAAIISIGHIMGFEVISEGVEKDDQLETLREIGCDYIQGFIWGRPLPQEEAEKLVTDMI